MLTVPVAVFVQPFVAVTVTVYVPALTALRFWLVELLLHTNVAPLEVSVKPPLYGVEQLLLSVAVILAVGNVGVLLIVACAVFVQPLVAVTVTVYVPPLTLLKLALVVPPVHR